MKEISKTKRIIKAIIILLILSLIIFLAIAKFTKNKEKTDTKVDNELSKKDYAYLLNRLYPNTCSIENINDYINLDQLSEDSKIDVAISSLTPKTVKINENDEFDLYNNQKVDYEWLKDFSDFGYYSSDVDNKIKEIFGKNTVVNHKSTDDVIYDKTIKAYINPPHGCGDYDNGWFQSIISVTKDDNKIYISTIAGSTIHRTEEIDKIKLCYNDDYKNLDETKDCILLSSLNNKYKSDKEEIDLNYDYEQYSLDNKNIFSQYKFTFEKEDDNYIIKKLEKIK